MLFVGGLSTRGESIFTMSDIRIDLFWNVDRVLHFTPSETRIFFVLANMADGSTLSISDDELSSAAGVSRLTLRKSRKRLVDSGLLSVSVGNGRGCKTVYILTNIGNDVPQPQEQPQEPTIEPETIQEEKNKRKQRVVKPKDGDLFVKKDMRPKRVTLVEVAIPSIEEVEEHFISQNIPKDVADMFYYHYDSLGWMTNNGVRVKRWQSLANKWITKERKEKNYGCNIDQESDDFKRSIAERVARAERAYREAGKHQE